MESRGILDGHGVEGWYLTAGIVGGHGVAGWYLKAGMVGGHGVGEWYLTAGMGDHGVGEWYLTAGMVGVISQLVWWVVINKNSLHVTDRDFQLTFNPTCVAMTSILID